MTLQEAVAKIQSYKRPNSANALALLEQFDIELFDGLEESLNLLQEYADFDRSDFEDTDSYSEARNDAWKAFVESLDDVEEVQEEEVNDEQKEPVTLAQAMVIVSQKVPIADKSVSDRFNRAYDIVRTLGEGYTFIELSNGVYKVHKESTASIFSADSSADYVTDNKSCSCPDFEKARAGLCKHRLAVMLIETMKEGNK